MMRLGIFGGTFSPPHIGHVESAKAFIEELNLDELLVIPTFISPHKEMKGGVSAEERLRMTHLAFDGIEKATVSDLEIVREGKSYTSDTLRQLSNCDRELFLFCGTDMFLTLDLWHEPETIFELSTVCYQRRENDDKLTEKITQKVFEYQQKYHAKIKQIHGKVIEISSTEIRDTIESHGDLSVLCPLAVSQYIASEGLYLDR